MDLLGSLKSYFTTKYVITDNLMCRLHHKASVGVLLAFSILVTGKQYVGDPIDCISKDSVPGNLLDTYCWIHKTFSVATAWHGKLGDDVAYPGVAPHTEGDPQSVPRLLPVGLLRAYAASTILLCASLPLEDDRGPSRSEPH
ncbi:hypothetical protein MRX96_051077 [Rhipicephalus microplus]